MIPQDSSQVMMHMCGGSEAWAISSQNRVFQFHNGIKDRSAKVNHNLAMRRSDSKSVYQSPHGGNAVDFWRGQAK